MENKVKMSKTTEVKDLNPELSTRKKLADSVIMNAKEIVSTGLRGKETKKIIDTAYNTAEEILKQNIDKLHKVAGILLEKEKIDGDEFAEIFE